jgi:hypothetical protein
VALANTEVEESVLLWTPLVLLLSPEIMRQDMVREAVPLRGIAMEDLLPLVVMEATASLSLNINQ